MENEMKESTEQPLQCVDSDYVSCVLAKLPSSEWENFIAAYKNLKAIESKAFAV